MVGSYNAGEYRLNSPFAFLVLDQREQRPTIAALVVLSLDLPNRPERLTPIGPKSAELTELRRHGRPAVSSGASETLSCHCGLALLAMLGWLAVVRERRVRRCELLLYPDVDLVLSC